VQASKPIFSAVAIGAVVLVGQQAGLFPVLKSTVAIGRQPAGFYLLPTNQLLRAWGEQAAISGSLSVLDVET